MTKVNIPEKNPSNTSNTPTVKASQAATVKERKAIENAPVVDIRNIVKEPRLQKVPEYIETIQPRKKVADPIDESSLPSDLPPLDDI